jgi:hypothetical protein
LLERGGRRWIRATLAGLRASPGDSLAIAAADAPASRLLVDQASLARRLSARG